MFNRHRPAFPANIPAQCYTNIVLVYTSPQYILIIFFVSTASSKGCAESAVHTPLETRIPEGMLSILLNIRAESAIPGDKLYRRYPSSGAIVKTRRTHSRGIYSFARVMQ